MSNQTELKKIQYKSTKISKDVMEQTVGYFVYAHLESTVQTYNDV